MTRFLLTPFHFVKTTRCFRSEFVQSPTTTEGVSTIVIGVFLHLSVVQDANREGAMPFLPIQFLFCEQHFRFYSSFLAFPVL
jgi:hypothetical protein